MCFVFQILIQNTRTTTVIAHFPTAGFLTHLFIYYSSFLSHPLTLSPVITVSQGERVRILAKPVSNKTSEILPPLTLLAHLLCLRLGQSFTKNRVKTVFLLVILEWGSMKKRIQKKKKKRNQIRETCCPSSSTRAGVREYTGWGLAPLKLESARGEQLDVLISCFATPNTKPLERANTEFSSDP